MKLNSVAELSCITLNTSLWQPCSFGDLKRKVRKSHKRCVGVYTRRAPT